MDKAIALDITRAGEGYRFRLEQPEGGALLPHFNSPPISRIDEQNLRQAVEQATRHADSQFSLEDLGRLMSNLLLPREIRIFLKDLKEPLLISTDAPEIPWELFYDNNSQKFLGIKVPVGRRLVTQADMKSQSGIYANRSNLSFLLVGNPRGDLPGTEAEVIALDSLLSKAGATTRTLIGGRASLLSVQMELTKAGQYLGFHFAGHANLDRSTRQYGLLLADKTRLTTDNIRSLLNGQPFVFLNVCGSDPSTDHERRPAISMEITEGLATAFIRGGALGVIGTRWDVNDHGAMEFASLFYANAITGTPVGEALRIARERFREKYPEDATWAAFVLYGDPCLPLFETAGLFTKNGTINRDRFEPSAQPILVDLPRIAHELGYDFIGTPHIIIALSELEDGITYQVLNKLGLVPTELSNALRQNFTRKEIKTRFPKLTREFLSDHAQLIFQAADQSAQKDGTLISEKHLLLGFIQRAEGVTLQVLKALGVSPEMLQAALEDRPIPEQPVSIPLPSPVLPQGSGDAESQITFAEDAQAVIQIAWNEALQRGYPILDTPHLVIGLTKVHDGVTAKALRQQGFEPKQVRDTIRLAMGAGPGVPTGAAQLTFDRMSARVQNILELARNEAIIDGSLQITETHLLMGFLKIDSSSTYNFLKKIGIRPEQMLDYIQSNTQEAVGPVDTPLLNQIGRDLTRMAQDGKLKPVIGRVKEIERIAQILARTEKNTPLLIGDAGVGKTAIVEGLAQRIIDEQIPPHLKGKRIIEIPLSSLVAGTKYRGDLEERLNQLLREAKDENIILFIDEIHTIVGAGRAEGGTLDIGNILKPALARGEIRCIGATTLNEYQQSIEKDSALERRFQIINVDEPSIAETLVILAGIKSRYESSHHVIILDEAVEAAINLSVAYIPQRRLPDKACDLLEEACVRARVGTASKWKVEEKTDEEPTEITIGIDQIAQVVAEWSGIPVARLTEAEQVRLLHLEELLQQRVVGQDHAISAIAQAIRLARVGLKKSTRPVGVFLFIGPSGVGKTELAKALANALFGTDEDLVRLDMSEFMEAHSISKLVGSPPGYVGHQEEGQLTGALRRKPYSVILLDEIEKAHPAVFDLFLQLFDDGRLTDAQGRQANGRNAIFILTSNIATDLFEKRSTLGFQSRSLSSDEFKHEIEVELGKAFRLEFLNRLDEVIIFRHLQAEQIKIIAKKHLQQLVERLKSQHGLDLEIEESAIELISQSGYQEKFGARHLDRAIEQLVSKPLSMLILQGIKEPMVVKAIDGQVTIEKKIVGGKNE